MAKHVSACQPQSSAPNLLRNLATGRRFKQDMSELNLEACTPSQEQYVLDLDACGLLAAMSSGTISSALVTSVYIRRGRDQGKKYNAVTEECFAEAIEAARESDRRRSSGMPIRPLEGLPISLKDCFNQKGFDSTVGLIANVAKPYKEDGLFVRILRDAGAVPFLRTTTPPFLLSAETQSNLFGVTTNPRSEERIPGGSSGGEAAMIASGGSPLGFGTDIGGSVRIPAHCVGICSFKCTTRRLSTEGLAMQEAPGQIYVLSMPGPMGKTVRDLVLAMRTLLAGQMSGYYGDVYCPPVPWQALLFEAKPKLRVGVMCHNGFFQPAGACVRGVREAAAVLAASGHEIVEFDESTGVPNAENWPIDFDGQEWRQEALRYEPEGGFMVPPPNRKQPAMPSGVEVMATVSRQQSWQRAFLAAWRTAGLDALLCPAVGVPAPRHGEFDGDLMSKAISYTSMFNHLQYPAGVLPVSTVRPHEQTYDAPSQSDSLNEKVRRQMEGSAGLPVGVQVVSLPYRDEVALRLMSEIEAAIAGSTPPREAARASRL